MKKRSILTFAVLTAALSLTALDAHAAIQTFEGIVSDSMCGMKHMMADKSPMQCTEECVKAGSSHALVVGDKVYTLSGNPASIAPFAGKHVTMQGVLKDKTITASIKGAKTAMPHDMPI